MVSGPRGNVVNPSELGVYHLWGRCVRQARLCGVDALTGRDYEYRRDWITKLEESLAALFAIEIGFHAELSNHIHLVVRNRPDIVERWSDRDVVVRWLQISHLAKSMKGTVKEISEEKISAELVRPGRVEELRIRLSDPSWFMAVLNENIGRRCNAEDGVKGHFWEERFSSRRLENEAAILICGIYVDLNQIRAGEAMTPEDSVHTSAYDRIVSWQEDALIKVKQLVDDQKCNHRADGWLCELSLKDIVGSQSSFESITGRRASDKGLLPITLAEYLQLLDVSGRQLRSDKAGAIPANLAPIVERLGIKPDLWCDAIRNFENWFGTIVGPARQLAERAATAGKKWLRGQANCAAVFG